MSEKRFFIATDLEGVVGVDSFTQTRSADSIPERKAAAMDRLAEETNACVQGIRAIYPDAHIDVLDGHGSGGLREEDLGDAQYLRRPDFEPYRTNTYDGLLMVGRHAMAGAPFAPLRHTQSSTSIAYYNLDGTFIGEIAGGAMKAGVEGIPLLYVSGDDKATAESKMFVPEVETTTTKFGRGVEAADHRHPDLVLEEIRADTARAVLNLGGVEPLHPGDPPYTMEIRFFDPDPNIRSRWESEAVELTRVDDRTVRLESSDFFNVYP